MKFKPDRLNKGMLSDDETLWEAFLNGYSKALSELFLRHYTGLLHYGIHLISDEEDVKDGIQQLFMKLWKKRDELNRANSVEFYLLLSLRRILFREKERARSRQQYNDTYVQNFIRPVPTVEDKMILDEQERERRELFQSAFETLTERQREVIILRLQHGLTNEEIAELMGITHQRVRNCIYEATQRLKDSIYNFSL